MNGAPEGSRTPGTRIRSPLLYPTELQAHVLERVKGIEPSRSAWKADVLPLNYTRICADILVERVTRFELATFTLAR